MNKYETFLAASVDDPEFSKKLAMAAMEIRANDLGISVAELAFNGDLATKKEINGCSLRLIETEFGESFNIPANLSKVADNWKKKGAATVFRGTRLPEHAGSFDFNGVHASPQIDIARNYASGATNNSTGIGRLLNNSDIGFVHAYVVPLNQNTYKNFQYEDALKNPEKASTTTIDDLRLSMESLGQRDSSDFFLDENYIPSDAMKMWYQLAHNNSHYEMILDAQCKPSATFLHSKSGIIKVDENNPHWDRLLSRVQEALLRDFYEIKPLEEALQDLIIVEGRVNGDLNKEKILSQVSEFINSEKTKCVNAPWEAMSMKDICMSGSQYINNRPYIAQGNRVGSALDGSIVVRPATVERLVSLVKLLQIEEFKKAQALLGELEAERDKASGVHIENCFSDSVRANDLEFADLIEQQSEAMSGAFPVNGMDDQTAHDVVADDLIAFHQIKGDQESFRAIVAIARNADSQVCYSNELIRQNPEVSRMATELLGHIKEGLADNKLVKNGYFVGEILDVAGSVVTQKIGRDGRTVMHDLKALSAPVAKGEVVDIKYAGGVGVVKERGIEAGVGI